MKRFIHVFMIIAVILTNMSLAFAHESTDISQIHNSEHQHEVSTSIEDSKIQPFALTCPRCDSGYLYNYTTTITEREYQSGRHGSCSKNYSHTYSWKYDVKLEECDSCNHQRTIWAGPEYGWNCK